MPVSGGVWMVSGGVWNPDSGWGPRVFGRCLGVYRCHINWKLLNKSHNIKTLPFLPVTSHRQIGAKWPFQTFHWARGFFWGQVADFWTKWLVLVHYKVLGGWHRQILISPIYQYTLVIKFWSIIVQGFVGQRPDCRERKVVTKNQLAAWWQFANQVKDGSWDEVLGKTIGNNWPW